ncbi:MAG: fibrobacter succinogenes major paralogous domain-containing protein [Bacteroidia bacterium]|jgi:uncharacterized protein (TIGR02145 family)
MNVKLYVILSVLLLRYGITAAQYLHTVHPPGASDSKPVLAIDSIRFNTSLNQMEIVEINGQTSSYDLGTIDSAVFNLVPKHLHSCGADSVHNESLEYGLMADQQGNYYKTITINNTIWMAENLRTSVFRNGALITNVQAMDQWSSTNEPAWVHYNNDSTFDCPYGILYNWYAVSHPAGLCPTGWHVPNNAEYDALFIALGGPFGAGNRMKTVGDLYWLPSNTGADNSCGFSAVGAGRRFFYGDFDALRYEEVLWHANAFDANSAWVHGVSADMSSANLSIYPKRTGFAVRCVKD